MKKKILHNWGLKLISLLIAIILWFLVVKIDDPKDTRSFADVPVTLINTELLEQENKAYEVLDNTDTLRRVTVEAPKSVIDQLRASDIVAKADISKLTEINTIVIEYDVHNLDVDVTSITGNHDVVKLSVEEKASKWIRVSSNITGEVMDGYIVSSYTADQTQIEISGPKSAVDKVSYASVEMDVSGATKDVSAYIETQLYDSEGNLLNLPSVVKNSDGNYVHMEVEVLATKEVPVEVNTMGEPAEGYLATGVVECDTKTIVIAGRTSTLASINKVIIPAEKLDITGRTASLIRTVMIKDYLPEGVKLADNNFNGRVTTSIYIEPIVTKTLSIPETNVVITGVPEGSVVTLVDDQVPYRITISGLNVNVTAVENVDVRILVDIASWMKEEKMDSLVEGTYEVEAKISIYEDVTCDETINVRFVVTEETEEETEEKL